MLIDWFTVVAQIVNFLVLVGLLKHFLYGPLIHAMDAREARIAAQVAEAGKKNQEADRKSEQVRQQMAELEDRGAQIVAEARKEADRERNEMVQRARQSVEALEQRWRDDLRLEQSVFYQEMRRAAVAEILATTRRVLGDLASADLERSAVEAFLEKLRSFDRAALEKMSGSGLQIVSATELPAELRGRIEDVIAERVGTAVAPLFERSTEMAWGIELRGAGQRIGWTPGAYLDSLEARLRTALDQRTEPGVPVAVE